MQQEIEKHLPDDASIRAYADGTASWRHLKDQGFTYYDVLEGLGRLGLHIPIDTSPEVLRGTAFFRGILQEYTANPKA